MNYSLLGKSSNDLVKNIFINRGFNENDIEHYLNTTREDILPFDKLMNVKQGAQILFRHIRNNDDILVQVDSDCDGMTSAAYLINYLYHYAPDFVLNHCSWRLHTGKQHGIIFETIPNNIKLVIAPDSSSNDYEVHKALHDKGIDVLVIDHHEADTVSEYACIINNQLCDYENKTLSGVGVVYKFCAYLDSLIGEHYSEELLDLAAVGIIGDMMDLRNFETKELINIGLANFNNPFLSALKDKQSYSIERHGGIDPFAVSFYLVPQINAILRSGTDDEKKMVFESMLVFKGQELIPSTKRGAKPGDFERICDQAVRVCSNVKNRQTKDNDALLESVQEQVDRGLEHKILIIKVENLDNKNLTGLLANQLASKIQRPTLVLNKQVREDGKVVWSGSGRNYTFSPIEDLRLMLEETNLVEFAQGHASAFGVEILDENLTQFIALIDSQLADFEFNKVYNVDWEYDKNNIPSDQVLQVAALKSIWGQGLPEPYVAIKGLTVTKKNLNLRSPDKYPTLVITLPNGIELIKFGITQAEYEKLIEYPQITLDVVGQCAANLWNGTITPQIMITDYELTGVQKYLF